MNFAAEVGKDIKAKNPAYANKSDTEIGMAFVNKYGSQEQKDFFEDHNAEGIVAGLAENISNLYNGTKEYSKGILKGVVDTAKSGSEMMQKIMAGVTPGVTYEELEKQATESGVKPFLDEVTTATNDAQKAGFWSEKLAEFFVPAGAASKVAKAGEATKTMQALSAWGGSGKTGAFTNWLASTLPKMGTEAASFGGVTAIQSGGDLEETAKASLFGGLFPLVTEAGSLFKGLKNAKDYKALIVKAISPGGKSASKVIDDLDDVIPALVKDGKPIKSLNDMNNVIAETQKKLWSKIDEMEKATSKAGFNVNGNIIAKEIEDVKNIPLVQKKLLENPNLEGKITNMINLFKGKKFDPMKTESLLQGVNTEIKGLMARQKIGTFTEAMNNQLAIGLRSGLDDAVSTAGQGTLSKLKTLWGKMSSVREAVVKKLPIAERQAEFNLAEQIGYAQALGGAVEKAVSGSPIQAVGGLVQTIATKGMKNMQKADSQIERAFKAVTEGLSKKTTNPSALTEYIKTFIPAASLAKSE